MKSGALVGLAAALLVSAAARADVEINTKPTSNMSCDAGVCTATAQKAVLNVSDLATMLASGDVAVKTGLVAKDIAIDQPLQWTSTARLTLDAQQSVAVKKQITVAGQGALTVTTNDTGAKSKNKTGEFIIVPEHGSVQFWDLESSLIIDGNSYTLVGDIKTLAADIAANPSGSYALAKPYDASGDGTYTASPIQTTFEGEFDGLGNTVTSLSIKFSAGQNGVIVGLFSIIDAAANLRHFGVSRGNLEGTAGGGIYGPIGVLAGINDGRIERCWTASIISISNGDGAEPGGLVGTNHGIIVESRAHSKILVRSVNSLAAGLTASNEGAIQASFSSGSIKDHDYASNFVGGLAGYNSGTIENAFALNAVIRRGDCCAASGGLIGKNDIGGRVGSSYAAGEINVRHGSGYAGGLIGDDETAQGNIKAAYWDLDTGISNPSKGAGNVLNDHGIEGLTDLQLKSALPAGFDGNIWGLNPHINSGYPFLLGNRPK